jgi:hypothetical protein
VFVVFSILHVPELARRLLQSDGALRENNPADSGQELSYPAVCADEDLFRYDGASALAGCRFARHNCRSESGDRVRHSSAGGFLTPAFTS